MPILENIRHEAFAQALAKGMTADAAYLAAGYKPSRSAASRLCANVNVSLRVEALRARASANLEFSLQWLLERTEEARQGAMEAGQHAAAIAAIKELGILSGHRIEKRENLSRTVDQMSDADLEAIARGEATTQH